MSSRPSIPVGDALRKLRLPGWLRWLLNMVKGTKIQAGPVDIQLDQNQGPSTGPSGMPHKPGPPLGGGR